MSTSTEQTKTKVNYKMVALNDSRIQQLIGDLENESSLEIKKKSEWLLKYYKDLLTISANTAKQQLPIHLGGLGHAIGGLVLQYNPQVILDALKILDKAHTVGEGSAVGGAIGNNSEGKIVTSVSTSSIGVGKNGFSGGTLISQMNVAHLLENEVLEITVLTRALYRLVDERERQLLQYRYLESALLDYEVVQKMAISERQYYRTKKSAILNYAECIKKMGFWVVELN